MAAVVLTLKRRSPFVGSYTPMRVEIDPASGLTIDDLEFKINSGLAGGVVSLSRGRDFDPQRPVLMLLAGYQGQGTPFLFSIACFFAMITAARIIGTYSRVSRGSSFGFSATRVLSATTASVTALIKSGDTATAYVSFRKA